LLQNKQIGGGGNEGTDFGRPETGGDQSPAGNLPDLPNPAQALPDLPNPGKVGSRGVFEASTSPVAPQRISTW
jgi:hypothetical protein